MKPQITNYTEEELKAWLKEKGDKPFRAGQIISWLYHFKVQSFAEMTNLSKSLRALLDESFSFTRPTILNDVTAPDGTIKFLQELEDGHKIETVLLRHADHNTLCISTQVGCAMGCKFCLTASMGLKRNLTAGEIVAQVLNGYELIPEGQKIRNLVFMGMGEPFHNYENTIRSLEILLNEKGFAYSSRRVTVSTSGLIPEIIRFSKETKIKANLAISLNGVTEESRRALMPVTKKYPLEELMAACRDFPKDTRNRITFEYVLIAGLTDSTASAKALVRLLHGTKSKVNLIPFNENPDMEFKAPEPKQVKIFHQYLLDHGILATLRTPRGQGASAACGQLAVQDSKAK